MGALRYSFPIRLVPAYILKFQPNSFKTKRLACVETHGQTDMAKSTNLVMLIKNIYALWGWKRLLYCVANFWHLIWIRTIRIIICFRKIDKLSSNGVIIWIDFADFVDVLDNDKIVGQKIPARRAWHLPLYYIYYFFENDSVVYSGNLYFWLQKFLQTLNQ